METAQPTYAIELTRDEVALIREALDKGSIPIPKADIAASLYAKTVAAGKALDTAAPAA